jgi:hypothetical protein
MTVVHVAPGEKVLKVSTTETARTPGGHAGREFCPPFPVVVPAPRRALDTPIRFRHYTSEAH